MKHQAQSQYWVTIQYTLFVSITSWLLAKEWDEIEGVLSKGDEVTVNGKMSGEPVNESSFWGMIMNENGASNNGRYRVINKDGIDHNIGRPNLRHRKIHIVATGHISDDKVHDHHAMQYFTNHELKELEQYMIQNFPDDIPDGHIFRLHQHSDNAGQHFKSTGAINYYTSIIDRRGGASETAYVYTFGAPGHGKGPYDRIGGRWKHKSDRSI